MQERQQQASDEAKLTRLLEQQRLVTSFALMLGQTNDLSELYETIHRYIASLMTANAFIVSSYDVPSREIRARFLIADGVAHDVSAFPVIPLEDDGYGIQSEVIRTGKPLYLPDFVRAMQQTRTVHSFSEDEGMLLEGTREEIEEEITTRSAILVPMKLRGETVGIVQVQSVQPADYTEEDVELLGALANVAAVAIQNAELFHSLVRANAQLKSTLYGAVTAIAMTTEIRDPYTAGHQRRVAELACAIASELGLEEERIDGLRMATLLHDIGKLAVPAEILARPARLSEAEMSLVRMHPTVAHEILQIVDSPWPLDEIVHQHHERLDGTGYPRQLRGDEILLEARILAVADVVEAMCSHRPYRPAIGVDAALAEIEQHGITRYDSDVAAACVRLFRTGQFAFTESFGASP